MARQKSDRTIIIDNASVISNSIIIVFKETDILKEEQNASTNKKTPRQLIKIVNKPVKSRFSKHNPEDNLSGFIGESDVPKSDSNIDNEGIKEYIENIIKSRKSDIHSIINENDLLDICDNFDYSLKELIEALVDKFPEYFNIGFLRSKIRPFIYSLRKDKIGYESKFDGYKYKPIFEYL